MRLILPQKPTYFPTSLASQRLQLFVWVCLWIGCTTLCGQQKSEKVQVEFFESRIRPVLDKHCYECHSAGEKKQKGGLLLDSKNGLLTGGDTGTALVAGKPEESLILSALKYDEFEMPPKGKLPQKVIDDFETWIANGAIDPRTEKEPALTENRIDFKQAKNFWSLTPPTKPNLPKIKATDWPSNRIDFFTLAKMETQNLEPAAQASNRELSRRLSFDLTGLPPQEISEDIDALVDSLLASSDFGEKWARLWLDLSRYAEDQAHIVGNNQSLFYPNAYRYRDWVINAFNDDLRYDDFVMQQLAIDLVAKNENRQPSETELAALGFIGLGPKYYRRNDVSVMADEWEDRVDTVSRGLLGLTVACARCHDHKYDPISTKDYYALAGVFASTEMYNHPIEIKNSKTDSEKKNKNKKNKPTSSIHIIRDSKRPRNLNVFIRGDSTSKGELVERRFLTVLDQDKPTAFDDKSSGRFELAQSITKPTNPLFARVFVNRVWSRLIGQPIVGTQSNFGNLGERPTHPKLLDDLAVRFIENGSSLKWLVREIVSSSTYRQSSIGTIPSLASDPANRFLSRMNRKRQSIEQWRDAILTASGRLIRRIGGPSMDPSKSSETRRTVYSKVSRFQLNSMLSMFDFPDPNAHAANRSNTITPLQKMFALNSPFLLDQASYFVATLEKEAIRKKEPKRLNPESSQTAKNLKSVEIDTIYTRLFQRKPSAKETELAAIFLDQFSNDRRANVVALVQTLMISNEFHYID